METKITIYIVEDEALIAENIKVTLEDLGYKVAGISYTYSDALQNIFHCTFDLILLDINLGSHLENTGLDIARQLRELNNIPFIFLTAFSDKDTILNATKLKPSAYLVKPVSASALFAAVQTAMENFYNGSEALLPNDNNVEPEYFFVKSGSKIVKVLWTEVYAITALKNYVKILTIQNPAGYLMRTSLQQTLTRTIPREYQKKFISVSRNTMVNRNFIKEVNSGYVVTPYGRFITNKSFLNTFVL